MKEKKKKKKVLNLNEAQMRPEHISLFMTHSLRHRGVLSAHLNFEKILNENILFYFGIFIRFLSRVGMLLFIQRSFQRLLKIVDNRKATETSEAVCSLSLTLSLMVGTTSFE